jgi:hypothetical protein
VNEHRGVRRWPLVFIAAPAAVAVWSGWVGLGGMCGFGLVQPFPGIVTWHLDTAITLPVGVEAYGAYALGAWLTPGTPEPARTFARRSAIGALALGMLGQVVYHLLAAAHAARAPWPVVVLVSCLPVVTLGFGAALTHLLRVPGKPDSESHSVGESAPAAGLEEEDDAQDEPDNVPDPVSDTVRVPVPTDAEHAALIALRATVTAGNPLSGRQLETRFGLTRAQATRVRKLALGDDEDIRTNVAANALPGLPHVEDARPRKLGEYDDRQADDDAGALIPA